MPERDSKIDSLEDVLKTGIEQLWANDARQPPPARSITQHRLVTARVLLYFVFAAPWNSTCLALR
jgi:hypothetical protein